jgi:hypothetical protein
MKTLNIEIPEGYEIDQEKSTFEKIVFKEIKKALPKTWEDLKALSGCYVGRDCDLVKVTDAVIDSDNRNVFKTEEQAKAAIALAQLSQLRDDYRQGWIPDYTNGLEKQVIVFDDDKPKIALTWGNGCFLSFPSIEIAAEFLNNFLDLINQARPLLS